MSKIGRKNTIFQNRDEAGMTMFVVRAKASYRNSAVSLSWEEKVASIERMRETSKLIKQTRA